ncbi:single-stranded DNA-binding protein [Clostridium sp. DL1XJH146]
MNNMMYNNKIYLEGRIVSELKFSHQMFGEGFYNFDIKVPRLSEHNDLLPITISERLLTDFDFSIDRDIIVEGQLRSYNKYIDGANRLILTVFARDIQPLLEKSKNPNQIFLNGFVCKEPIYRVTPFGREIADILLAVNRAYNKSDYIPTISWGRNSRFCKNLEVGDNIRIWGRLQSREYQKKINEDNVTTKIAYEVSISKLEREEEDTLSDDSVENGEDINKECI